MSRNGHFPAHRFVTLLFSNSSLAFWLSSNPTDYRCMVMVESFFGDIMHIILRHLTLNMRTLFVMQHNRQL